MMDAVVVVPPPVTGQTLVTELFCRAIIDARPCRLWPIRNQTGLRGLKWTLNKHSRIFGRLLRLALKGRGRGSLYTVPDSGGGLWLNLLEAPLLRLGFREIWLHHHVFSYVRRPDRRMALILKILGPKARHVVLGESMAEGLRRNYNAHNVHQLGNAIFIQNVPITRQRRQLRTVGFLGNITREKGIDLFMDTIRQAQKVAPDLSSLVAGPIRDAALQAEVEAFCAEAPDKRRWLGPVSGTAKEEFFAEMDLLLFPSLYHNEALPVTIYEALAAGAPVLATRRGCIPGQLAGLGWCLGDLEYVTEAAARIVDWVALPDSFAAASQEAANSFTNRQDEDRRSLQALIRAI